MILFLQTWQWTMRCLQKLHFKLQSSCQLSHLQACFPTTLLALKVYVTVDAKKASLKAVHLRCWKEGAEDHAELRPLGCWVGRNWKTLETTRTHGYIYIIIDILIYIYIYLVYTYRQLHLSEFHWPIRRYHDASPKLCYLWHVAATLPPRQSYFPSSFMPNGTRLWYVAGTESLTSRVRWM